MTPLAWRLFQESVWGDSVLEYIGAFIAVFGLLPVLGLAAAHLICHHPGCYRPGKHPHKHWKMCGKHLKEDHGLDPDPRSDS